jgi:hypothetical protein
VDYRLYAYGKYQEQILAAPFRGHGIYQLNFKELPLTTATKSAKNGKRLACDAGFRYSSIFQHAKTIKHGLQTKNNKLKG